MHIKNYIKPIIKSLSANQTYNISSTQYVTFDYVTCADDPNVPPLVYQLGSGEIDFCEDPSDPFLDEFPESGIIMCNETGDMEHPITTLSVKPGGSIDCATLSMTNVILNVSFEDESALPKYCTITSQVMGDDDICE